MSAEQDAADEKGPCGHDAHVTTVSGEVLGQYSRDGSGWRTCSPVASEGNEMSADPKRDPHDELRQALDVLRAERNRLLLPGVRGLQRQIERSPRLTRWLSK